MIYRVSLQQVQINVYLNAINQAFCAELIHLLRMKTYHIAKTD